MTIVPACSHFCIGCIVAIVAASGVAAGENRGTDVRAEINKLYDPANRVSCGPVVIPGGELLRFSQPMINLIEMGEDARKPLHALVNDTRIQNEVVVILGAIGDKTSVPLLIEAYPETAVKKLPPREIQTPDFYRDPAMLKIICFTYALTYLTGVPIGRTRWGADLKPENRRLWREWWKREEGSFTPPAEKPNATWVPEYPKRNGSNGR